MLPSSNGGADGAIGVCSLNLLGGVSGMRLGVLPSDMFLQQCVALSTNRPLRLQSCSDRFLAMESSTKASDNRFDRPQRAADTQFQLVALASAQIHTSLVESPEISERNRAS